MAISKEITKQNGVTFSYHRIVSLNAIANHSCIIEVASYINQEQRKNEARALADGSAFDVMVSTRYVTAPYDPNMGITGAYDYIKGVEPYNDPQDVFEDGNDPVAFADAVATGAISVDELPEGRREEILALIPEQPAHKEGFLTVARMEPLGYRIYWEFVVDPNYDPEREDGSYSKPFKYVDGMEVIESKWYWLDDKLLPHECIKSGTPADFYDREFFDFVEESETEPEPVEPPVEDEPETDTETEPETPVEPVEPDTEETPTEPDPEPQEPSEPAVEEVEKQETPTGDYANPIAYEPETAVTAGLWYTDGEDIWECIADGVPTGFDDTEFFDIVG